MIIVFCQLQSIGHRNSRIPADLMNPGGGGRARPRPVGRRPDLSLATGPKDLFGWDIISESGNVAE